ncbi:MAG: hypothetical protein U0O22_08355 [Acutalibacteraceae bacterium]
MKKLFALLLIGAMAVSMVACNNQNSTTTPINQAVSYDPVELNDTTSILSEPDEIANGITLERNEYIHSDGKYVTPVLKNETGKDCDIVLNIKYKDENGNVVDVQEDKRYGVANGEEVAYCFNPVRNFNDYHFTVTIENNGSAVCIAKDIENKIETKDLEDGKEITITLTNNSEHKAKIPQANILFFKDKKMVYSEAVMVCDKDYELKSGKSESATITVATEYDDVKVYYDVMS